MELEKIYEPQRYEPIWARWWVDNNVFRADVNAPGPIFSIVVPSQCYRVDAYRPHA